MRKDSLKSGDKFGRLTVIDCHHSAKRRDGSAGERVMLCLCECGEKTQVKTSNLKSGNTKSCGCLHSDSTVKSNKARANSIDDINENIAYACHCGCVSFNILKSKDAECTKCQGRIKLSKVFN